MDNDYDELERAPADPFAGVLFSGVMLVLGVGAGRQVPILAERCQAADGLLVVMDGVYERLAQLQRDDLPGEIAWMQGRLRRVPLMAGVSDLVMVNGLLREVPGDHYPQAAEELWRVMSANAQLRIADILEADDADPAQVAWAERNRIVRRLGLALNRPVAVAVDLRTAIQAFRSAGFEDAQVALLPGYHLTEDWLQETAQAIYGLAGRVADCDMRTYIVQHDLQYLGEAFMAGDQRAPGRFVLQMTKPGDL
ncbi:MAG: class I SAM-dependent methyltransferase [Chloroflexi bacterium]|nr:class I SAM-dependent methyltransferase [Chloroflexota bacterium]